MSKKDKTERPCYEEAPVVFTDYGVRIGRMGFTGHGPECYRVVRYERDAAGFVDDRGHVVASFENEIHAQQYARRMRGEC